jgi:hypothetical protein
MSHEIVIVERKLHTVVEAGRQGPAGPRGPGAVRAINLVLSGGGEVLELGPVGRIVIDEACVIGGWTLIADQVGSLVMDVRRATPGAFPVFGSIAGLNKPTLANSQRAVSSSLAGWSVTALAAGDMLEFAVETVALITGATVALRLTTE